MILCIDIDQVTKSRLDQLVTGCQYRDYSQAIAVAVANQVLLHQRMHGHGHSLLVDDRHILTCEPGAGLARTLPTVFQLPHSNSDPNLAPIPKDVFPLGAQVPVDRWIFGQHNKLLPVKASCRYLANVSDDGQGVPLAKAASEIPEYASELGDFLQAVDEKHGVTRDEMLAAAFPVKSRDKDGKARLRFANQFVASMNKQGDLSGLSSDLKLLNLSAGKQPRLLLTEAGWRFAAAENPVLDRGVDHAPRFSEQEIDLLMDHIRVHVPAEDSAFRTITKGLLDGADTPEKLDAYLKQFVSQRANKPFTDAFLITQRSGAISRMADLCLLEKEKQGVKVKYRPTHRAVNYLAKSERGVQPNEQQ